MQVGRETLFVSPSVLAALDEHIGAFDPERGGALLGPQFHGRFFITMFIPDPTASTTSVSYVPSEKITAAVRQAEISYNLVLKGIVHSHPKGHDYPSLTDHHSFHKTLHENKHLQYLITPIITHDVARNPHELALRQSGSKISFFVAAINASGIIVKPVHAVKIFEEDPVKRISPLFEGVARELGLNSTKMDRGFFDSQLLWTMSLHDQQADMMFIFGDQFPMIPPILLATVAADAKTVQLHPEWDIQLPPFQRLLKAASDSKKHIGNFLVSVCDSNACTSPPKENPVKNPSIAKVTAPIAADPVPASSPTPAPASMTTTPTLEENSVVVREVD